MLSWFQSRKRQKKARLKELLANALVEILVVDDRETRLDCLDLLLSHAENEEDWVIVILSMIKYLPDSNALSSTLLCYLLHNFALHSMEAARNLNKEVFKRIRKGKFSSSQCRNTFIVWSILAEKLAGNNSAALFTDEMLNILMRFLQDDQNPTLQIHALITLEKFSITQANKNKILATNIVAVLQRLEQLAHTKLNTTIHQVKYCARWSLDNIFPSPDRDFSIDKKKMKSVQVMLNNRDTTGFLKLARHGLEARNDTLNFESIRGTSSVSEGAWYYEVTICTSGILQIGWATKDCRFESEEGSGVGDDSNSIAYDGCRRRIWHRGISEEYGANRWKPGDIVGTLLDLDEGQISFSLNGENLGLAFQHFESPPDIRNVARKTGFYPAVSFTSYEHCIFNFGHKTFKFPPPDKFRPINSIGKLTDEDRYMPPKLFLKSIPEEEIDYSKPLCQICCSKSPNAMFLPCEHEGFCFRCTLLCEKCPICRQDISSRLLISESRNPSSGNSSSPSNNPSNSSPNNPLRKQYSFEPPKEQSPEMRGRKTNSTSFSPPEHHHSLLAVAASTSLNNNSTNLLSEISRMSPPDYQSPNRNNLTLPPSATDSGIYSGSNLNSNSSVNLTSGSSSSFILANPAPGTNNNNPKNANISSLKLKQKDLSWESPSDED